MALIALLLTLAADPVVVAPRPPATAPPDRPRFGWYLGHSVRVLGNLGAASPAMFIEVGARWRNLSFGIGSTYKPASWGPVRFDFEVPEDVDYGGRERLRVGAQFATIGLMVTPAVPMGRVDWLALEFPLGMGVGILGTPLLGSDRVTPDGDRVSVWENRLTDGGDLSLAFAGELGVRARLRPAPVDWFHVVAGVQYIFFSRYESSIVPDSDAIDGLGGSLGFVFGRLPEGAR